MQPDQLPQQQPEPQTETQIPNGSPLPGKTLSIVGFVLSILSPTIGLILSMIAFVMAHKSNRKNNLALAGIIIGSVLTILGVIIVIFASANLLNTTNNLSQKCNELGPGTHIEGSSTFTCN
jgi:ABC-type arginine transport system permease subunit